MKQNDKRSFYNVTETYVILYTKNVIFNISVKCHLLFVIRYYHIQVNQNGLSYVHVLIIIGVTVQCCSVSAKNVFDFSIRQSSTL